jgi:hydrogenase maturation factor
MSGPRARVGIEIVESRIPVREEVRAACEFLGLDPLYTANEGKVIVRRGRGERPCSLEDPEAASTLGTRLRSSVG